MNIADLQPGQRRPHPHYPVNATLAVRKKWKPTWLRCRCDVATLSAPLPAPVRGSFCKLCLGN